MTVPPALRQAAARLLPALSVLSWIYLFAALWLGIYVAVGVVLLSWQPVVVTSGSMAPHIAVGDVVLLSEPDDDVPPPVGSVVTFRDAGRPDQLITHRVADVLPGGDLQTRGDANPTPDVAAVGDEDLVGVGRLLVPVLGTPASLLHDGDLVGFAGWIVLTVVAVGLTRLRTGEGPGPYADAAPEAAPPLPASITPFPVSASPAPRHLRALLPLPARSLPAPSLPAPSLPSPPAVRC